MVVEEEVVVVLLLVAPQVALAHALHSERISLEP